MDTINDEIDVMANWTVVEIGYYEHHEPKLINYKLFGEEQKMTINYHAVSVDIDGDIPQYITEQ